MRCIAASEENNRSVIMQFDPNKPLVGFDMDMTLNDHRGELIEGVYIGGGNDAYREVARTLRERYPDHGVLVPTDADLNYSHRHFHSQQYIFRYHFPKIIPEEAREIWDAIPHPNKPVKGAPETVRGLREDGYPLFIVTSKPEAPIHERLEEIGINPSNFLFIVTTDGERYRKPSPEVFTDVVVRELASLDGREGITDDDLRKLNLWWSVYVGDHPDDYTASELARRRMGGPQGISVPSGYFSKQELLEFPDGFGDLAGRIAGVPEEFILDEIGQLPDFLREFKRVRQTAGSRNINPQRE